jgi:hypothetical protein
MSIPSPAWQRACNPKEIFHCTMPSSWRGLHARRVSYHLPVALATCPMAESRGKTLFNSSSRLCLTQVGGGLSRAADGSSGMGQVVHVAHMAVYVSDADAMKMSRTARE